MSLYEYIQRRKSTRKYKMSPLPPETLEEITTFAQQLKPLDDTIKVEYELATNVKILLPVKCPHYFLIYSSNDEYAMENVGFMFQQMDLFLSSKGLGSCWLGMAKPVRSSGKSIHKDLEFVIALGFGEAVEDPHRSSAEFNRKPLEQISQGLDVRIESARLAPSSTNSQNWFFVAREGRIHCLQKKLSPLKAKMYHKMNRIDMGIAICHLYLATINRSMSFEFCHLGEFKVPEGYYYTGSLI